MNYIELEQKLGKQNKSDCMRTAEDWNNILLNTDMYAGKEIIKKIQLATLRKSLNIIKSMSDKVGNGRLELSYAETHYQNALDDAYEAILVEVEKFTI